MHVSRAAPFRQLHQRFDVRRQPPKLHRRVDNRSTALLTLFDFKARWRVRLAAERLREELLIDQWT
ncbi:MAG: hypothetical protein ACLTW6_07275 [Enterobacter sp.]